MRALKARENRMLAYLGVFLAIVAWDTTRRRWSADVVEETKHYVIYSTATPGQTIQIGHVAEIVYAGYRKLAGRLECEIQPHAKLKIKLFKDRQEFRHCNRIRGWAEAFYRKPYCYQYYSSDEIHPYHWMMHEATHQLNAEVAHLALPQWLDEGLACYVSTSRIVDHSLALGQIDTNTYPVWWLDTMTTSGDLESDKRDVTIIPLRRIISGRGGPDIDDHVNLYYLHWWSLAHFLMEYEGGIYRAGFGHLLTDRADVSTFEKHVGQIEAIEKQWYGYFMDLKQRLAGHVTPSVKWELQRIVGAASPDREGRAWFSDVSRSGSMPALSDGDSAAAMLPNGGRMQYPWRFPTPRCVGSLIGIQGFIGAMSDDERSLG